MLNNVGRKVGGNPIINAAVGTSLGTGIGSLAGPMGAVAGAVAGKATGILAPTAIAGAAQRGAKKLLQGETHKETKENVVDKNDKKAYYNTSNTVHPSISNINQHLHPTFGKIETSKETGSITKDLQIDNPQNKLSRFWNRAMKKVHSSAQNSHTGRTIDKAVSHGAEFWDNAAGSKAAATAAGERNVKQHANETISSGLQTLKHIGRLPFSILGDAAEAYQNHVLHKKDRN